MSKQIAVRLPDEVVAFIDSLVAEGEASSRAAVVTRALHREQRRRTAVRDAEILAAQPGDPDLDGLGEYATTVRMDDLE